LPVVLCTDDEGIIDLGDCPCCENFVEKNNVLTSDEKDTIFEKSNNYEQFENLCKEKLIEKKTSNEKRKHKSVKHEYCMAIHNGDIKNIEELKKMFNLSIGKTFFNVDHLFLKNQENIATAISDQNNSEIDSLVFKSLKDFGGAVGEEKKDDADENKKRKSNSSIEDVQAGNGNITSFLTHMRLVHLLFIRRTVK
jgi:hypothetical protein